MIHRYPIPVSHHLFDVETPKEPNKETPALSQKTKIPLEGGDAFYKKHTYEESTEKDFSTPERGAPIYTYDPNPESWTSQHPQITRVVRTILPWVILPIGVWDFFHWLIGKIAVPASLPWARDKNYIDNLRAEIPSDKGWAYKRITIKVPGDWRTSELEIDAVICVKKPTLYERINSDTKKNLGERKWMIYSNPNSMFYEENLADEFSPLKNMATEMGTNAITFNHVGVGASSGSPDAKAMERAYQAVLTFVEEELKATEIIGYGHSIGAAVQLAGLENKELKKDIDYLFISSRTFHSLRAAITGVIQNPVLGWLLGGLATLFGWNINVADVAGQLKAPHIILQTSPKKGTNVLLQTEDLAPTDGIISKDAALATKFLNDKDFKNGKDIAVFGIEENHNENLNPESLEMLKEMRNHIITEKKLVR